MFFERGLVAVTAEYNLEEDGRIRVKHQGFKGAFEGKTAIIEGYATVPAPESPAKLRVRFDPFPVRFFPADYWIIELDQHYAYAVVSGPSRRNLWIMSRTPTIDRATYDELLARLGQRGFDINKIEKTQHPDH